MSTKKVLSPKTDKYGYQEVVLYSGTHESRKQYSIHRLVAITFLPNPNNLETVNHKDEDKTNNCVENLEWMSRGDNIRYGTALYRMALSKYKHGKYSKLVKEKLQNA